MRSTQRVKTTEFQMWLGTRSDAAQSAQRGRIRKKCCCSYHFFRRTESVSNRDRKFTNHGQAKRNARDHLGKQMENTLNINYDLTISQLGIYVLLRKISASTPERLELHHLQVRRPVYFHSRRSNSGHPARNCETCNKSHRDIRLGRANKPPKASMRLR